MHAIRLSPLSNAPIPRSLEWTSHNDVKERTYQAVVARMGCGSLNEKQKEHIGIVYKDYIMPSVDWVPETEPDLLTAAVNRCNWVASPAFRLKVYGEFCQYLHPECLYEELGQLKDAEKKDAEFYFLQSASRPHLVNHLDQIRDAIEQFSSKYPRANSTFGPNFEGGSQFMQLMMADEARIREETERRWPTI